MNASSPTKCLIAVGCNQGECKKNIRVAIQQIEEISTTRLVKVSSLIETIPVGDVQGTFLNGAILVETELPPEEFMLQLLSIESEIGRDRCSASGDRPIDLDILLFGKEIIDSDRLTVPHPRMTFRRFVLEPAVEIAAEMIHPILNLTLGNLLHRIRHERNVIVVLLCDPADTSGNDWSVPSESNDNVLWIQPADHRDLLSGLRQSVTTNEGWLVVLSTLAEILGGLHGAIKLLVVVGNPETSSPQQDLLNRSTSSVDRFLNESICPRWDIECCTSGELQLKINTAIDAMRPIANV